MRRSLTTSAAWWHETTWREIVLGNIFAFVAGLATAGLLSYLYPQLGGKQLSSERERSFRREEARPQSAGGLLDLNEATEEELQELSGIGPALSARIVENRPYRNKLELVSRMVIPEAAYERIKDQIAVGDSAEEPIQVAL